MQTSLERRLIIMRATYITGTPEILDKMVDKLDKWLTNRPSTKIVSLSPVVTTDSNGKTSVFLIFVYTEPF